MRKYATILTMLLLAGVILFWKEYKSEVPKPVLDEVFSKEQIKPLLSKVQDMKLQKVYYPLIAKKLLAEKGVCPVEGIQCGAESLAAVDEANLYGQYGRVTLLIARGQYEEAEKANDRLKALIEKVEPRPSCLYVLTLLRKAALLSEQKKPLDAVKNELMSLTAYEVELIEKVSNSEGLGFKKIQDFVASKQ